VVLLAAAVVLMVWPPPVVTLGRVRRNHVLVEQGHVRDLALVLISPQLVAVLISAQLVTQRGH
jgi:hypothetical protein